MIRTPNLVLIGFMGTGKSAVGRTCATQLGFPYHDTDTWISRRVRKPISQIFAENGEAFFRDCERDAVRELSVRSAIVLSTGGGVVLDPENTRMLRESGIVVLLTATVETILARVGGRGSRPLLQSDDPESRIRALLLERDSAYRAAADAVVDTSDLTREEVAEQVVALYQGGAH